MKLSYLPFLALTLAACSSATSTDPGDTLFSAGGTATPNVVLGVWEQPPRKLGDVDAVTRLELRADHAIMAMRCTRGTEVKTPSITLTGAVTDQKLEFGEGKQATAQVGNVVCGVQTTKGIVPRCADSTPEAQRQLCFIVKDKTFTLYQPSGPIVYTKVAD
jgi:hypothetical protein